MSFFPGAVPTTLQLLQAKNNIKVVLDGAIGLSETTIPVLDASNLPTSGDITFADTKEIITYTGKTASSVTGATRGADGTAAAVHADATDIEMRWNARYHNILTEEIRGITQNLSDRIGLDATKVTLGDVLTIAVVSNQVLVGTTNKYTFNFSAPAAARAITLADPGGAASFVMTAGAQSVAGAKTLSDALTIAVVSDQLLVGTTNKYTVNFAAPAAARALTLADPGGAASFVMSASGIVAGNLTFSGTTVVGVSNAGSTNQLSVVNPANTAGTTSLLLLSVGGTSAGDPYMRFDVGSTNSWAIGPDNSDSDKFKISWAVSGATLGTNDFLVITTAGQLLLTNGSAALSSIAAASDSDTGVYWTGNDRLRFAVGGLLAAHLVDPADLAATEVSLNIYDADNAAVEQVTVGAADSGGAGFKVLRIPN